MDQPPDQNTMDITWMTVADLKRELKVRGAKVSGRKKDLVERLEASNFGRTNEILPEYRMHTPDKSVYLDINADSPYPCSSRMKTQDIIGRTPSVRFEARPAELHNDPGAKDRLNNLVINGKFKKQIGLAQCIDPANTYAMCLDHN